MGSACRQARWHAWQARVSEWACQNWPPHSSQRQKQIRRVYCWDRSAPGWAGMGIRRRVGIASMPARHVSGTGSSRSKAGQACVHASRANIGAQVWQERDTGAGQHMNRLGMGINTRQQRQTAAQQWWRQEAWHLLRRLLQQGGRPANLGRRKDKGIARRHAETSNVAERGGLCSQCVQVKLSGTGSCCCCLHERGRAVGHQPVVWTVLGPRAA